MKVKIGDQVFDAELEPVMLILSAKDRANIAAMSPDATRFLQFPDDHFPSEEAMKAWAALE